ncbi:hypothetical protein AAFF_G00046080 [Aldrovandia affinis]|uniref:Uncharacterized protein n=1 Tax=Aldrovandia affinis TaxID=143900 RepID=A0AAD7S1T3_9TELE|nr:hypothetical protein AAFF_G00046080 [Aldrovandia affinis]
MLGEGFIMALKYREDIIDMAPTRPRDRSPPRQDPASETRLGSTAQRMIKGKEEVSGLKEGLEQSGSPNPSPGVLIPRSEADQYPGLELYRSWGCISFCKDYPDLQLRGDHVGDRDSESLGPEYENCEGPLLQSKDLGELEPLEAGPVPPGLRVTLESPHDKGYLVMDSSITLNKREPLSNSMLNDYLESKLLEVYRQHLQDSLARSGFTPGPALPRSVVPPSVDQLTQQLSLEQGLDVSMARGIVANYLSSLRTGTSSSHFSSPILRISNPDQKKKASAPYQPL